MTVEDRLNALLAEKDQQIESLSKVNAIVSCQKERVELQATTAQQRQQIDLYRGEYMPIIGGGFIALVCGLFIGLVIGCAIWKVDAK